MAEFAKALENYAFAVSVVVALPVAVPLAVNGATSSYYYLAANPAVVVNASTVLSGYFGLGIESNSNFNQFASDVVGQTLSTVWPPYPGH